MSLHPQAKAFVETIARDRSPGWETMTPDEARRVFNGWTDRFGRHVDVARVEDFRVAGDTVVRLYDDCPDVQSPVIVFFHGGGWVLGNIQTHDAFCRQLAKSSRCTVVSVEYGLAPENQFPGPVQECFDVTEYFAIHGERHGVDGQRIAVAGDSVGGNLAACVALMARDRLSNNAIDWTIQFQVLIYPVITPDFETASYLEFSEGYGLTRATMQWFWQHYLGKAIPDERAVPTKARGLNGLPPAHVVTAQYDVLRDEGNQYARKLDDSDVPVTHRQYDGMVHGFMHFAGLFDIGYQAIDDVAAILSRQLLADESALGNP